MPVQRDRRGKRWYKKNHIWKEIFLPLENEEWLKEEEEEGGRDSEEFMLVWWGPGLEQRWGAERTLRTRLDDWSPSWVLALLQRGKEMLMFTLTTSRLYNVNVKLHRRVQSHPPCLYTSFIYIFKNTALTRQTLTFLSVYTLQTVKTSSDHRLKSKSNNFL